MHIYYVYIATNQSRTLYIGVTNDLRRRMYERKNKLIRGFAAKYSIDKLVYYEASEDALAAIEREKYLKGWCRQRKIQVIETMNPFWEDLTLLTDW